MDRVDAHRLPKFPSQDGRDLLDAGHGPQLPQQVAVGQRDDPSPIRLDLPSTLVDDRSQFKIFPYESPDRLVPPVQIPPTTLTPILLKKLVAPPLLP